MALPFLAPRVRANWRSLPCSLAVAPIRIFPLRGDGTPLIVAAAGGHTNIVTLLLERGARHQSRRSG